MERRLAAILAADVVGYSRLMEADEAGTLATLADRRKAILEPLLARYRGRVVRLMGDGTLVEFSSAVDAVQCAVDIQKAMKEANATLPRPMSELAVPQPIIMGNDPRSFFQTGLPFRS